MEIKVGLEFNTTTDQVPAADVVVYTITEALNNPNNTFNLTLDPNSITVIRESTWNTWTYITLQ